MEQVWADLTTFLGSEPATTSWMISTTSFLSGKPPVCSLLCISLSCTFTSKAPLLPTFPFTTASTTQLSVSAQQFLIGVGGGDRGVNQLQVRYFFGACLALENSLESRILPIRINWNEPTPFTYMVFSPVSSTGGPSCGWRSLRSHSILYGPKSTSFLPP